MGRFGNDPNRARIKTGTYTGDGTTSQAITGVGFEPKLVIIWIRKTSEVLNDGSQFFKTDQDPTDMCLYQYGNTDHLDNRLISLDSDGFTVDDDGTNVDPNTGGETYLYIAFG